MGSLEAKPVAASATILTRLFTPRELNVRGTAHGGEVMRLIDECAGVCAMRHARRRCVTARIDELSFLAPVRLGDVVTCRGSVNDVGSTSMEVGVRVEAEDPTTGEVRHVASAYLVFVALDDTDKPTKVPPIIAETAAEQRRQAKAKLRRAHRLARSPEV
ncbi:MAG: acyl-CoA thioesterase [Chloroflexi bacterium]|nr:acyl-CoA thioesterase [Chloroflexota bacterium]